MVEEINGERGGVVPVGVPYTRGEVEVTLDDYSVRKSGECVDEGPNSRIPCLGRVVDVNDAERARFDRIML